MNTQTCCDGGGIGICMCKQPEEWSPAEGGGVIRTNVVHPNGTWTEIDLMEDFPTHSERVADAGYALDDPKGWSV